MQETSLLASLIMFVLILLLLGAEILIARRLEKGRTPRPPGQLPYTWGYFCGIQGFVFACLAILGSFVSPQIDKSTAIVAVLGWGVPGYFVI